MVVFIPPCQEQLYGGDPLCSLRKIFHTTQPHAKLLPGDGLPAGPQGGTWQRYKMKTDPDYRTQQRLSQQKWLRDNPDYWRGYRRRNPDKTEKNRTLQHLRNRRSRHPCPSSAPAVIAKMDARKSNHFYLVGRFYLVPLIAKMDASTVALYSICDTCR